MSLLDLPNELLVSVAEKLVSEADIGSLVLVNRRLHTLLDKHLYRQNATTSRFSALLWASEHGSEITAQKSLNQGASIDATDEWHRTPLSLASARGNEAVVRLLLEREDIDVNPRDEMGQTPLLIATEQGHVEIVRLLLAKSNVNINARDEDGQTALVSAAQAGLMSIVCALLAHDDVNINLCDYDKRTPLIAATMFGKRTVVDYLLQCKHVDIHARDCDGQTAQWWARQYGWDLDWTKLGRKIGQAQDNFKPTSYVLLMKDFLLGGFATELNIWCSTGPMCTSLRGVDLFMSSAKPYLEDSRAIPIPWTGLAVATNLASPKVSIRDGRRCQMPQPPISRAVEWVRSRLEQTPGFQVEPFEPYQVPQATRIYEKPASQMAKDLGATC
ncbi:Inversin [Tolypocladium ophioglossoides CBS 100239]|uniref:Inversin n=1 Tax=Tolypocladium ophioglossoides (strain CBS 100239) TaxID=1163406 RepID=A0A0L0NFF5_TOLOC|nr:Inversin [Tolypocladium ophioglossoides CBS 100239]